MVKRHGGVKKYYTVQEAALILKLTEKGNLPAFKQRSAKGL
jgi:hypothetical protein